MTDEVERAAEAAFQVWDNSGDHEPNGFARGVFVDGYRARAAEPEPSIVRQTSTVAYLRDGTRITIDRGKGANGPRLSVSRPEVKALATTETLACFLCDRTDEHTHAPESARAAEPPQPASVGTADFPGDWSDLAGIGMKTPLSEPPRKSTK